MPRFHRLSLEKAAATCHVQACRNKGLILQAVSGRVKDDLGAMFGALDFQPRSPTFH